MRETTISQKCTTSEADWHLILTRIGTFLLQIEILKTLDFNITLKISHFWLKMARMAENERKREGLINLSYQSKLRLKWLNIIMENRKYSISFQISPYNADWLNVIINKNFVTFLISLFWKLFRSFILEGKSYLNYTYVRLFLIQNLMAAIGGVLKISITISNSLILGSIDRRICKGKLASKNTCILKNNLW